MGRKVVVNIYYSENMAAAEFLRLSAARSRYVYIIGNLAAGYLLPILPGANNDSDYRAIVLAKFEDD